MQNTSYVTQVCNAIQGSTDKILNYNNQLSDRETYLIKFHVSASAFTKPYHPNTLFGIISLGVNAILRHAQDIVWQSALLHKTYCHDKNK